MENILAQIDQIIVDDKMTNLDYEDVTTLFEDETERIPADLKERILQGDYI